MKWLDLDATPISQICQPIEPGLNENVVFYFLPPQHALIPKGIDFG